MAKICRKEIAQIARSTQISEDSEVFGLLKRLCKGFKTELSTTIVNLLNEGKYRDVIDLYSSVKPEDYQNPDEFFQDRFLVSFLAKFPFRKVTTSKERAERALKSVVSAENRCRETNIRFLKGNHPDDVQSIILSAQRKIANVLGSVNISQIVKECRFGPGQTLSISEPTRTGLFFKLTCEFTATASLLPFADSLFLDFPGLGSGSWSGPHKFIPTGTGDFFVRIPQVEVCNHNRISTVPKTSLSDRPIAVEPHLNQFLQLGVGAVIRNRLKRVGIDILHAQAKHRELARFASIYPSILATLDLSSASDTISYRVVEELLPKDWFHLLNLLRSPRGKMPDGTLLEYEKFSSMGNGYTFELETLIFWAICSACNDIYGSGNQTIAVYGDDMIVPTEISERLIYFLDQFGFVVNASKSYNSPTIFFRESCGGDYFMGRDVRPIFLTKELDNALRIIELANRIRWECTANNLSVRCHCSTRYLWLYLLDRLPDRLKRSVASLPGRHGWAMEDTFDENYRRESDYHSGESEVRFNCGNLWVPPSWFNEDNYHYDNDIQQLTIPTLRLVESATYVSTAYSPAAQIISGAEGTLLYGRVALRDVTRIVVRHVASTVVSRY